MVQMQGEWSHQWGYGTETMDTKDSECNRGNMLPQAYMLNTESLVQECWEKSSIPTSPALSSPSFSLLSFLWSFHPLPWDDTKQQS